MASIRAGVVRWFMKAIRADAGYASADAAKKNLQRNAAANERPLRVPLPASKVTATECSGFPVYWLHPTSGAGKAAILYLHGGAFTFQPTIAHWRYANSAAAAAGLPLALAVYPKAPTHRYTEAYDFIADVYLGMREAGFSDVVIVGDSAGATLTLGFTMWLMERGLPLPAAIVPLSPCVDLAMAHPDIPAVKKLDPMLAVPGLAEIVRVWSGGADLADYRLSPIHGNIAGLPPTLIIIGSDEILCPDTRLFAQRAAQAGAPVTYHEYPGMMHDFPMMPIPEARRARREIIDFIMAAIA